MCLREHTRLFSVKFIPAPQCVLVSPPFLSVLSHRFTSPPVAANHSKQPVRHFNFLGSTHHPLPLFIPYFLEARGFQDDIRQSNGKGDKKENPKTEEGSCVLFPWRPEGNLFAALEGRPFIHSLIHSFIQLMFAERFSQASSICTTCHFPCQDR